MMMKKYIICMLWFVGISLTGCSDHCRLSGKVSFEDGTPATRGMVIFTTESFQAKGEIQLDGSFVVGSEKVGDGIPRGTYGVYVSGIGKTVPGLEVPGMQRMSMYVPICHEKYENAGTSGLVCTVPAPGNKYDIVLEPHPTNYP